MKFATKLQLSKTTLILLTLITVAFIVSAAGILFCAATSINPFKESTASLLFTLFFGVIGLAIATLLLNVAINLSIIADSKISEIPDSEKNGSLMGWGVGTAGAIVVVILVLLFTNSLSESKIRNVVKSQAEEVLSNNDDLLETIGASYESDFMKTAKVVDFLGTQRAELPRLVLIYPSKFEGKLVFNAIETDKYGRSNDSKPEFYRCSKGRDCEYLKEFFTIGKALPFDKFDSKSNEFFLYFPYEKQGKRFVLLFEKRSHYGKY